MLGFEKREENVNVPGEAGGREREDKLRVVKYDSQAT